MHVHELEAQLVRLGQDGLDLRGEVLRWGLLQDPRHDVEPHPDPAMQPRPDEPSETFAAERAHASGEDRGGPVFEQLAAPLVMATRGAREHEGADPFRMADGDDLGEDAAHRGAHHVRVVDPGVVEDGDGVVGHLLEGERMGSAGAAAHAPVVGGVAAEVATEREALQRPAPRVDTEALQHEQRGGVASPERLVRDGHAVAGRRDAHGRSLRRAWTWVWTSAASSAAASWSSGPVPAGGNSGSPKRTRHGRPGRANGKPAWIATGSTGNPRVATSSARGASAGPDRNHVGASGAAATLPARRGAATSSGR